MGGFYLSEWIMGPHGTPLLQSFGTPEVWLLVVLLPLAAFVPLAPCGTSVWSWCVRISLSVRGSRLTWWSAPRRSRSGSPAAAALRSANPPDRCKGRRWPRRVDGVCERLRRHPAPHQVELARLACDLRKSTRRARLGVPSRDSRGVKKRNSQAN